MVESKEAMGCYFEVATDSMGERSYYTDTGSLVWDTSTMDKDFLRGALWLEGIINDEEYDEE